MSRGGFPTSLVRRIIVSRLTQMAMDSSSRLCRRRTNDSQVRLVTSEKKELVEEAKKDHHLHQTDGKHLSMTQNTAEVTKTLKSPTPHIMRRGAQGKAYPDRAPSRGPLRASQSRAGRAFPIPRASCLTHVLQKLVRALRVVLFPPGADLCANRCCHLQGRTGPSHRRFEAPSPTVRR